MRLIFIFILLCNYCLGNPFAEFVARCPFSHRLNDDPIVYPNQPGVSHLHDFFGSTIVNAFTNDTCSLLAGPTTCNPTGDKSSYWVPTLFDPSGQPVRVKRATFYYQTKRLSML